ncbi:MAG: phosphate acyltransferase, partial [Firmicutes bacterium]|nr:phosphate acyltransferase [Bacillota bacterium]
MNKLIKDIRQKASVLGKTIVLPEGEEPRTLRAARQITDDKIAKVILIGNVDAMKKAVPGIDLKDIKVIDPNKDDMTKYTNLLYEVRKAKGMTLDEAKKLVLNPLYLGVLLVKAGECDGMVGGALNSTGDTLRPALQIIKTAPGISTVSSCFVMALPEGSKYGEEGVMVFGDCAVNIAPNSRELADIAVASAHSAKAIAGITPRVAMLSFSTKGS